MPLKSLANRPRRWAGSQVVQAYLKSMEDGEVWSIPFHLWASLPRSVRHWMEWRLLAAGEELASTLINAGHPLEGLRMPPTDGWSLAASTRFALHDQIERHRPRRLLEFGSGLSTLILSEYARRRQERGEVVPHICSVEHDEQWLEVTRCRLQEKGLDPFVTLIHAPLRPRDVEGSEAMTYDLYDNCLGRVSGEAGFDFLLIDGPPATIGRGPCLPLAAPWLGSGALVLLDDAYRPAEQAIWRTWCRSSLGSLRHGRIILTNLGLACGRWVVS